MPLREGQFSTQPLDIILEIPSSSESNTEEHALQGLYHDFLACLSPAKQQDGSPPAKRQTMKGFSDILLAFSSVVQERKKQQEYHTNHNKNLLCKPTKTSSNRSDCAATQLVQDILMHGDCPFSPFKDLIAPGEREISSGDMDTWKRLEKKPVVIASPEDKCSRNGNVVRKVAAVCDLHCSSSSSDSSSFTEQISLEHHSSQSVLDLGNVNNEIPGIEEPVADTTEMSLLSIGSSMLLSMLDKCSWPMSFRSSGSSIKHEEICRDE